MAIQRWDSRIDLRRLQDNVNRMFEDALGRSPSTEPPLDLIEQGERYVVRADLPGVGPAEVEVRVEDGALVVSGERKGDGEVPVDAYLRVERPTGRFSAFVRLPSSVDRQRIEARFRNGVLEIVLPKRLEPAPGRIEVLDS
jgi:HSP20 family protein